jgi:hypothetical protein
MRSGCARDSATVLPVPGQPGAIGAYPAAWNSSTHGPQESACSHRPWTKTTGVPAGPMSRSPYPELIPDLAAARSLAPPDARVTRPELHPVPSAALARRLTRWLSRRSFHRHGGSLGSYGEGWILRPVFLVLHIASGAAALVLGPLALFAAARRRADRDRALAGYHWAVLATCATAVVVSVLAWSRLWWLVPVAAVSYLLVLAGYLAVRRGWPAWVRAHGLGGSYIALVTALLVVSLRGVSTIAEILAWILPAAVGTPLIVRAHTGARRETRAS